MDDIELARRIVRRIGRDTPATAPLARATLDWARRHERWLLGVAVARAKLGWRALLVGVEAPRDARPLLDVMAIAAALGTALAFDAFDRALLVAAVAADRVPRIAELIKLAARHAVDLPALLGEAAGADAADAARLVRRSAVLRFGLASFSANRAGEVEVDVGWTLDRLLDRAVAADSDLVEAIVGKRQAARLAVHDFAGLEADAAFILRLLGGALSTRAGGVNILLHGPPGTGKTELARTLGAAAGARLFGIGEADDDGEEPTRWDRVNALRLAQRLLAGSPGTLLLFDEMEDLIGDGRAAGSDVYARREGSKVFINRLLETNAVPVIWTTNSIANVDPAILRRMSFVLKLDAPSRRAGAEILDRLAVEEAVSLDAGTLHRLVASSPRAVSVARVALRSARLADAGEDGATRIATALVGALDGGRATRIPAARGSVDLDLYETAEDLATLFDRLAAPDAATDFSLLLTGPPGTGKTGLAHALAERLDRPLIVKRASDLLSKWVGESEQRIAAAFAEAVARGGVLLFDEVDSLLADRGRAEHGWEVSQVNELLNCFDDHPLPFVAATNHDARLDPAALRRFVFKLHLEPLSAARAARAWRHFFDGAAPPGLAMLQGLTPGDLAVVARQLRHVAVRPDPAAIVARLAREVEYKPGSPQRAGF